MKLKKKRFQLYYILVAIILTTVLAVFYYNNLKVKSAALCRAWQNDNDLLDILDMKLE
jgi:hypothetical protein